MTSSTPCKCLIIVGGRSGQGQQEDTLRLGAVQYILERFYRRHILHFKVKQDYSVMNGRDLINFRKK